MHKVPQHQTTCQGFLDNSQDQAFQAIEQRDLGAFCPAALDDWPLSLAQFRVYMHLCRRAGRGACWTTQGNIAEHLGLSRKTVNETIQSLIELGFIEATRNPGNRLAYVLLPIPPAPDLKACNKKLQGQEEPELVTQSYKACNPTTTSVVTLELQHKVLPKKGIPRREEDTPPKGVPPLGGVLEVTNTRRPVVKGNPANAETWAKFDAAYPTPSNGRALSRTPARLKWDRLADAGEDMDAIIEGARRYSAWIAKMDKGDYVAMMPTWLNQRRWEELHEVDPNAATLRRPPKGETMREELARLTRDLYDAKHA